MGGLRISTLGGLSIELDGRPVTGFASAKAAALLVYLACNPYLHPREVLAELLWNERTQQRAQGNLRVVLSSLRKEVGDYVTINRERAGIDREADIWVDATEVEQTLAALRREASAQAAMRLTGALALYKGEFLAGVFFADAGGFELWATTERQRVHRLVVDGLQQLGAWHMEQKAHALAVETATRLLKIEPLSETGHRQLMEALARSGQRKEALAQYERSRQLLWEELGVEPAAATVELAGAIQLGRVEMAVASIDAHRPAPIPVPATPLIGREMELAEIGALLRHSARLVSIVAPGGMGKTRLALEVAQHLVKAFDDGVAFADVSVLSSTDAILPTIAQALSLHVRTQGDPRSIKKVLMEYLRNKELLLVLDGFEHLIDGAPLLTELLEVGYGLKLLITTRERLKLQPEQIYLLTGLAISRWDAVEEAEDSPAVQLFMHHARRTRPSFVLRHEHLEPLQRLLRIVEGVPLAVILAAAWVEVLSPAEIEAELIGNLDFLQATNRDLPRRQQSMRAIFEATWARLTKWERQVFAALSVFRGSFTLDAARAVINASQFDILRLVDRSLVTRVATARFAVHELLRHFAAVELTRSGAEENVAERHSAYFCKFIQAREQSIFSSRREEVLTEIAADLENVRTAWDWAAEKQRFSLLHQAAISFGFFYLEQWRIAEGLANYERATERLAATTVPFGLRTLALLLACQSFFVEIYLVSQPIQRSRALLYRALAYARQAASLGEDTRLEEVIVFSNLGANLIGDDNMAARQYLERSLVLTHELDLQWGIPIATSRLAWLDIVEANYRTALDTTAHTLYMWDMVGTRRDVIRAKMSLAIVLTTSGHGEEGLGALFEARSFFDRAGDYPGVASAQLRIGEALITKGRFIKAWEELSASFLLLTTLSDVRGAHYNKALLGWTALHLGRFEDVWIENQHPLLESEVANNQSSMLPMVFLKGCAGLALGYKTQALEALQKSVIGYRDSGQQQELSYGLAVSSYSFLLAGNSAVASEHLVEVLALARALHQYIPSLLALSGGALLLAELGQPARALELYTLAYGHPFVANSRWFEAVVGRRLAAVAETLPAEVVQAARERGAGLELWETVDRLVGELGEL